MVSYMRTRRPNENGVVNRSNGMSWLKLGLYTSIAATGLAAAAMGAYAYFLLNTDAGAEHYKNIRPHLTADIQQTLDGHIPSATSTAQIPATDIPATVTDTVDGQPPVQNATPPSETQQPAQNDGNTLLSDNGLPAPTGIEPRRVQTITYTVDAAGNLVEVINPNADNATPETNGVAAPVAGTPNFAPSVNALDNPTINFFLANAAMKAAVTQICLQTGASSTATRLEEFANGTRPWGTPAELAMQCVIVMKALMENKGSALNGMTLDGDFGPTSRRVAQAVGYTVPETIEGQRAAAQSMLQDWNSQDMRQLALKIQLTPN